MNRNISFIRKVVYVGIIALLLFPLFYLGQPATRESKGGLLAEMRNAYGLTQSGLGEIDPASETMKLSTLGLRPVAVALLWNDANEYKKKEDWDHFSATVKQIVRLQPNFIKIWDFQAHNISYNVSVEFDNYRHRYHWVKKGFDFLTEGTHYNRDNPLLLQRLGWFYGQKIGRADEQKQFRRLFRADTDFHEKIRAELPDMENGDADGPDGRPDNWLVGRLWNLRAQDAVDRKGKPLVGSGPLIFYSYAPMMRINFAKAIEDEGYLEEQAEIIWMKAGDEWRRYGERDIVSSWGHAVRLASVDQMAEEIAALGKKLDELAPGVRQKLAKDLKDKLTAEQRAVLEKPDDQRNADEAMLADAVELSLVVPHHLVIENTPTENQDRARRLGAQIRDLEGIKSHTENYCRIVNYDYWKMRCEAEQKKETVAARRHQYNGVQSLRGADLENARKEFEKCWELWLEVLAKYPRLIEDAAGEELEESISKYERVLGQLDKPLPDDPRFRALRDYFVERKKGSSPRLPSHFRAGYAKKSDATSPEKDSPKKDDDAEKKSDVDKKVDANKTKTDDKPAVEDKKTEEPKKPDTKQPDEPKSEDKPTEEKKPEEKKADDKEPADKKSEDKKSEDKKEDKIPEGKPADDKSEKKSDEKKSDEKPADEKKPADAKPSDPKADSETPPKKSDNDSADA